jgi:hypothetical protein
MPGLSIGDIISYPTLDIYIIIGIAIIGTGRANVKRKLRNILETRTPSAQPDEEIAAGKGMREPAKAGSLMS